MSSRYGWHGRLAVATAVAATFGVAATAQAATTVELSSGTTALKLDGKTTKALKSAGITVTPSKPASVKSGSVVFPVSGGSIDPATAKGTIDHKGGLTLKMGKTKVALTAISLNTSKGTVTAKNGKKSLALGTIAGGKVSRRGFSTSVSGVKVKLAKKGAAALNTAFDVRTFKAGLALGTAKLDPVSQEIAIERGTTTLTFNAQTAGGLRAMNVPVTPTAPATVDPATGTFSFPISGGTIDTTDLSGRITHSGGLTLGTLPLADLTVSLGATPTLAVSLGTIADLGLTAAPVVNPADRTISVSGVTVRLNEFAATALNTLFGRPAFTAGAEIATTSLNATAR